jgi:hypothetical protein
VAPAALAPEQMLIQIPEPGPGQIVEQVPEQGVVQAPELLGLVQALPGLVQALAPQEVVLVLLAVVLIQVPEPAAAQVLELPGLEPVLIWVPPVAVQEAAQAPQETQEVVLVQALEPMVVPVQGLPGLEPCREELVVVPKEVQVPELLGLAQVHLAVVPKEVLQDLVQAHRVVQAHPAQVLPVVVQVLMRTLTQILPAQEPAAAQVLELPGLEQVPEQGVVQAPELLGLVQALAPQEVVLVLLAVVLIQVPEPAHRKDQEAELTVAPAVEAVPEQVPVVEQALVLAAEQALALETVLRQIKV